MNTIISIAFIYCVIFTHELGHYYAAKWTGIPVIEVCFGKGKKLLTWVSGQTGTIFTVRLLPLGGYNLLLSSSGMRRRYASRVAAYENQALWKRAVMLLAGCMANAVCALAIGVALNSGGSAAAPALRYGLYLFAYTAAANLVPLPGSDGAHVLSLAAKAIRRRRRRRGIAYARRRAPRRSSLRYTWE